MRAAPHGTLYPAPIVAPKPPVRLSPIRGLLHGSYIRRERDYDNLLTDVVQLECELALSTNKATFSDVQEHMWGKNTELNHFFKRFRVRPGRVVVENMERWAP